MITLIFCGDLKYCPYIHRYTERLELKGINYNVLFWNRSGEQLSLSDKYMYFEKKSILKQNNFYKLIDFVVFKRWAINYIKKHKPEKCILLSSLTGVLFANYLIRKDIPYVFDIRDYSYENILLYYRIEKKVIENSYFTAISSKGFTNFLPDREYVIAHNFNRKDIVLGKKFVRSSKIRLVWNGVMRFFNYQRQIITKLANDPRYEIIYYGDGPDLDLYKRFCSENDIINAHIYGKYDNKDKGEILSNSDFINNCYGYIKNAGCKLKYAVSNKFYDGIIYHIPQLVEEDGYKTNLVLNNGVGTTFRPMSDLADSMYMYYESLDESEFDKNCDNILREVLKEDDKFIECIDSFVLL